MISNNFDMHFEQSQKRFNILFRIISTLIAVVFVATVGFWILVGVFAFNSISAFEKHGIKGVVEQIWCGKEKPNCINI